MDRSRESSRNRVVGRSRPTPERIEYVGQIREFYAGAPFVRVLDNAPRVKDIVASNYAHLSAASNGRSLPNCGFARSAMIVEANWTEAT